MAHLERIMYVELKDGGDSGPAWIGRVRFSKTGRTLSYRGHTLQRARCIAGGNHVDQATGEEYWVSGVKKDGTDPTGQGRDQWRSTQMCWTST